MLVLNILKYTKVHKTYGARVRDRSKVIDYTTNELRTLSIIGVLLLIMLLLILKGL